VLLPYSWLLFALPYALFIYIYVCVCAVYSVCDRHLRFFSSYESKYSLQRYPHVCVCAFFFAFHQSAPFSLELWCLQSCYAALQR
jgi:hypothetical protein